MERGGGTSEKTPCTNTNTNTIEDAHGTRYPLHYPQANMKSDYPQANTLSNNGCTMSLAHCCAIFLGIDKYQYQRDHLVGQSTTMSREWGPSDCAKPLQHLINDTSTSTTMSSEWVHSNSVKLLKQLERCFNIQNFTLFEWLPIPQICNL